MELKKYLKYPVKIEKTNSHYLAVIKGFENLATQGATKEKALQMAQSLIIDYAFDRFASGKQMQGNTELKECDFVIIPYDTAIKIMFRNLLLKNNISLSEVARLNNITPQNLQKRLNLFKSTKIDLLFDLFKSVGFEVNITVND